MELLAQLILQVCLSDNFPGCPEEMNLCLQETFKVSKKKLTPAEEDLLPFQIQYCRDTEFISGEG